MSPNNIMEIAEYLGLQKPFDIRIKSKAHKWAAGFCEQHTRKGKIIRHVITIYLPSIIASNYTLESVIAHELIHAWQAENGELIEGKYHGRVFQDIAADIGRQFKIPNIFGKYDTD
jgi:SprT-like family